MTDEGSRSKLVHLLQPIRSLSDNWDVNIAAELEEYLVRVSPLAHVKFNIILFIL